MSLTREERDEWRALVNNATPGPWSQGMIGTRLINEVDNAAAFGAIIVKPEYSDDGAEGVADASFIAESITVVPALLDALDEAEATITGLREALTGLLAKVEPYGIGTSDLGPCIGYYHARNAAQAALARPEFPNTERPTNA